MGKGDNRRPAQVDAETFEQAWERTFGTSIARSIKEWQKFRVTEDGKHKTKQERMRDLELAYPDEIPF